MAIFKQNARLLTAVLVVFGLAAAAGVWVAQSGTERSVAQARELPEALRELAATDADIKVYKTPDCGCCSVWVEYLEDEGFTVEWVDVDHQKMNTIKQQAGLSRALSSCHTGFIDGYVIEGHVPAEDIRQLVQSGKPVAGIAVPGMPIGSPGMEFGDRQDPYDVMAFDRNGGTEVFSSHHQD